MTDRLQALLDADANCSRAVGSLFAKHGTTRIQCSEEEWNEQTDVFAARDAARAALMPTERDAIKLMHECYTRLKELGWNDPQYCPKDGSEFDVIELGSTGIFKCVYQGEWPTGSYLLFDEDCYSSRPALYRITEREIAAREELRRRFSAARDQGLRGRG